MLSSSSAFSSATIAGAICGTHANRESQIKSIHTSIKSMWVIRHTGYGKEDGQESQDRAQQSGACVFVLMRRAKLLRGAPRTDPCSQANMVMTLLCWLNKSEVEHRCSAQVRVSESAAATRSEAGIWSGVVGRGGVAAGARCVCASP